MFAAISPFEPGNRGKTIPGSVKVEGEAKLRFTLGKRGQVLDKIYCRDPLRVLFPRPERDEPQTAVIVNTSGGLVGGDRLDIDVEVGEKGHALITGQAAEKTYRSAGRPSRVDVNLGLGNGSRLEWLPQGTILFEGARIRRETRLALEGDAQALAGEILIFGRMARGERLTSGLVHDHWEVRRDGRLIWADSLHLMGDLSVPLEHPAGFNGARVYASAVYVASKAEEHLETARRCLIERSGIRTGVTALNGILVSRWLGKDPYEVRKAFAEYWSEMRHRLWRLPRRLPRLFNI